MAHPGLGWPTTPARSKDGQCGPSSPSAVPAGVAGPAAELMPDAVGGLVWWRTISLRWTPSLLGELHTVLPVAVWSDGNVTLIHVRAKFGELARG
jgi:hypothetical protein